MCAFDGVEESTLSDGKLRLRVLNVSGDAVHEMFERLRTAHKKVAAAIAVAIDVGDSVLLQLLVVSFGPLG